MNKNMIKEAEFEWFSRMFDTVRNLLFQTTKEKYMKSIQHI